MSVLHELGRESNWISYLDQKKESRYASPKEIELLESFIKNARYRSITDYIADESFEFPLPRKAFVSKKSTNKKRVVYIFPDEVQWVLKLMNHLLSRRYDHKLSSACYSFRPSRNVRRAVENIGRIPNLQSKYTLKLDLSSYSNSIPVEKLIAAVEKIIDDDPLLISFLKRYLRREKCISGGKCISEPMGAMTGTPIVGFLGNIYLREVDEYFLSLGLPYFRYGDDIMIFLDTHEEQQYYLRLITDILVGKLGLKLNPEKVALTSPGENWEYLGFSSIGNGYDLAEFTVSKTKDRIRRYARYLYREKRCRQGMGYEEAVSIFLNRFNSMFFDIRETNEFAWSRWYFSIITTSKSLKEIDACMQRYIRYIYSGRHYKGNYKITYSKMKEMGYRSLVHEYYQYLENAAFYDKTNLS